MENQKDHRNMSCLPWTGEIAGISTGGAAAGG